MSSSVKAQQGSFSARASVSNVSTTSTLDLKGILSHPSQTEISEIRAKLQKYEEILKLQILEDLWTMEIRPRAQKNQSKLLPFETDSREKRSFCFMLICESSTIVPGQKNTWIGNLQIEMSFHNGNPSTPHLDVIPAFFFNVTNFVRCGEFYDGSRISASSAALFNGTHSAKV